MKILKRVYDLNDSHDCFNIVNTLIHQRVMQVLREFIIVTVECSENIPLTLYSQSLCIFLDNIVLLQTKFLNIEVGCYVEAAAFGDLMFFRLIEDLQLVLI